ncbi:MAG: BadF/BadG/BcrA/BcrD ATPase family protein [Actinomycetota bacterium]
MFAGVDVGSATVKVAGLTREGPAGRPAYLSIADFSDPGAAVRAAYGSYLRSLPPGAGVVAAGTTGSGRELQRHLVGAAFTRTEIVAHAAGLLDAVQRGAVHLSSPWPGSIVEIGGQDAKVILFHQGVPIYFNMNSICSAGTGEFLRQIADEAGIPLEEFGPTALTSRSLSPIDPTCTVFSRRDFRHLTQKGVPLADRLMGIARAMVRNYLTNVASSQRLPSPVVFQGGVAANAAVVRAFAEALGEDPVVPLDHGLMGSYGMAVLVRQAWLERPLPPAVAEVEALEARAFSTSLLYCHGCQNACEVTQTAVPATGKTLDHLGGRCERGQDAANLRPEPQPAVAVRPRLERARRASPFRILSRAAARNSAGLYFAGFDGGSRGIKWALLRSTGPSTAAGQGYEVVAVGSVDTCGDTLAAILRAAGHLAEALPDGAEPVTVGTTGSARELAYHVLVGAEGEVADVMTTEIIAHYVWASEVLPAVQTVVDVGGNDSKVICLTPTGLDFGMNDKCAAGTGSFLEAVAKRVHVPLAEYGETASQAARSARVAGRCAVFGESDLIHKARLGFPVPDLLVGVAEAVVRTYVSDVAKGKVLAAPMVGQGGALLNGALVRAFRDLLGLSEEEFFVHPDPRFVLGAGALGAALLAKDRWERGLEPAFRGLPVALSARWETASLACLHPDCPKGCPGVVLLLKDGDPVAGYRGLSCEFGLFSGLIGDEALRRETIRVAAAAGVTVGASLH